MVAARPLEKWVTPEEYLNAERMSDTKHEYIDGGVYAMSGASRRHVRITTTVIGLLFAQLRGRGCSLYSADMRLRVRESGMYTYPDAMVVCGDEVFVPDSYLDTLLNPTIVFEVLSPSTEAYDKGKKFEYYQTLPSLQHYVLIAQDRARIEVYTRISDDGQETEWRLRITQELDSVIALDAIGCTLALADVYEGITFDDPDATPPATTEPSQES